MNHYCTYFDAGFLVPGLAMANSLHAHDPQAVLWVLALDEVTADVLRQLRHSWLRVTSLAELECDDPALAQAKANRNRVEYYFTLSPCWPRRLLQRHPEIARLVYLDADLLFFSDPAPIWSELARGSVLVCAHDFPDFLKHYERHGKFNVGVLGWNRDRNGLACLDWWRERCLDWCRDRLEADRYADQKYLEQWPRLFDGVVSSAHPGINLAPWNWMSRRCAASPGGLLVDGRPLVAFHFARFRAIIGDRWWCSGQLDYGVMPWNLRRFLYGRYFSARRTAEADVRRIRPEWRTPSGPRRLDRAFWRSLPLRFVFGSDWLRVGNCFASCRLGMGRYSGRVLAKLRTIFLRK